MRRADRRLGVPALLGAFVLGAALGIVADRMLPPWSEPPVGTVTCRPTSPETALADHDDGILLLWGNSLLFDNGWSDVGMAPVNCARQGMTAAVALPLTAALPGPPPDRILLAFGSVEAARAAQGAKGVDTASFSDAMSGILSGLALRWPEAEIIVASVPDFGAGALRPRDTAMLNEVLADLARQGGEVFVDLDALFGQSPPATYDGVHVTPAAYRRWEAHLRDAAE